MNKRRLIGSGILVAAAGYVAGILTAPRSGRRTRNKLKNGADIKVVEKELRDVYDETKKDLAKLSKEHPKLTAKLNDVKEEALNSQGQVQKILKAASKAGSDSDLNDALQEAKKSLNSIKKYLSK